MARAGKHSNARRGFHSHRQEFGTKQYREGSPFAGYIPYLRARLTPPVPPAPLPAELRAKVPAGSEAKNVIDIQQSEFRLAGEGDWVSIIDDAAASDKKAARMRGDTKAWAIQYSPAIQREDMWHYYIVARIELKDGAAQTGAALDCGIYENAKGVSVSAATKMPPEFGDGKYHIIDLGAHPLSYDHYVWVAPVNNSDVTGLTSTASFC
jgi:hypothetical protein